jgi:hypothetical protein
MSINKDQPVTAANWFIGCYIAIIEVRRRYHLDRSASKGIAENMTPVV